MMQGVVDKLGVNLCSVVILMSQKSKQLCLLGICVTAWLVFCAANNLIWLDHILDGVDDLS